MSPRTRKIPVTVLTGFLGSGKTTLVNHILTADHGQRIAVIENEFGEIPIDGDLVLGADETIIEMSNGCCLCCTARTDLIDILRRLLARSGELDRILIETSGMADPNPVAQTFFVDDEVAQHYDLDAIVTLVDAKHVGSHLAEVDHNGVGRHVYDQIAFADRIVVNKADLVDAGALAEVADRMREINATADIITSSYARIDLDEILGVGAFELSRTLVGQPDWLDEPAHLHDPTLGSVSIELDGDLRPEALESWLGDYVAAHGADIYRLKGVLAVKADHRRFVAQGVHKIFEVRASAPWGTDPRRNRFVVIGRDLDRADLLAGLQSCLA